MNVCCSTDCKLYSVCKISSANNTEEVSSVADWANHASCMSIIGGGFREEWACGARGDYKKFEAIDVTSTNQKWLSKLAPEKAADVILWLVFNYGRDFTDTRLAIIEWLKMERKENE